MNKISLCPVANHSIVFFNREKEDIVAEIEQRLNALTILNREFLLEKAINKWGSELDTFDEFSHERKWYFKEDYFHIFYGSPSLGFYTFCGPYGLKFDIGEYTFSFYPYLMDYESWYNLNPLTEPEQLEERNKIRTYFYQVLKALGGNEMVYLATFDSNDLEASYDSGLCHEEYLSLESFTQLKIKLRDELGQPANSFYEVQSNFQRAYYIDKFKDLNLPE